MENVTLIETKLSDGSYVYDVLVKTDEATVRFSCLDESAALDVRLYLRSARVVGMRVESERRVDGLNVRID